jgi:pSer/pThr/pTyr-binding forkhead associated (FHA) protein
MQICRNCGSRQLDGTIFCSECGDSLPQQQQQRQTTASLTQNQADFDLPDHATVIPAPEPLPPLNDTLNLVVLNSGRRLMLAFDRPLLVGRTDPKTGEVPDVDLGRDSGYDAGVSRRHARIFKQENYCVLEDLKSANGTFINGRRILPHQPMPLQNGDEIRFGKLLLRVEFNW